MMFPRDEKLLVKMDDATNGVHDKMTKPPIQRTPEVLERP
jgi:hypothetical protein